MDDETMTTPPEPFPEPDPAPTLVPDPEPADPVIVVSVDELIDRLLQGGQEGEGEREENPVLDELPFDGSTAMLEEGGIGVEDVVPGLIGDVVDILQGICTGMEPVESIESVVNHPALTTPFQDYTVTEGLLLLLLMCFFLKACANMIRRAFSWLL